jgi:hydrogenase-4 component B
MSRLGGLARVMPWTAGLFALGSVAAAGLPPLNGFVSEWLIYLGLFDAVTINANPPWIAIPAVVLLATAGALALAAFAKACAMIFLGAPRTQAAVHAHECGRWMRGPMVVLAVVCAVAGLAPVLFWPALSRAVGAWNPAWAMREIPAPLATLGAAQIVLAILVIAAAAWLWHQARANGVRRGPTWDCGYAAPTARMQYTSASFAGIVAGWFGWILQPERKLRRPRGYFPAEALRLERVPETVLERVITPVGDAILGVSTAVRRLQHGRLQFYILYLVAGMFALGLLVVLGGMR